MSLDRLSSLSCMCISSNHDGNEVFEDAIKMARRVSCGRTSTVPLALKKKSIGIDYAFEKMH